MDAPWFVALIGFFIGCHFVLIMHEVHTPDAYSFVGGWATNGLYPHRVFLVDGWYAERYEPPIVTPQFAISSKAIYPGTDTRDELRAIGKVAWLEFVEREYGRCDRGPTTKWELLRA